MQIEKILIIILVVAAAAGLVWAVSGLIKGRSAAPLMTNTPANFQQAVQAELADECQTPEGYTDEEWQEHMSHHPDRYQDCLQSANAVKISRKDIGVSDLAAMLKQKDFTLIDVHIPEQVHVPDTDAFIPFNEIDARLSELPQDKNAKIVLYCRSGTMSQIAAKTLIAKGYTNIYNLVGGMNAWQAAGYDVDTASLK